MLMITVELLTSRCSGSSVSVRIHLTNQRKKKLLSRTPVVVIMDMMLHNSARLVAIVQYLLTLSTVYKYEPANAPN